MFYKVFCCFKGKRFDGLPDWVWFEDGFEFQKMIPNCIDPTYCESAPPLPQIDNVDYTQPPSGSLRYQDGEIITYTCQDDSKYISEKMSIYTYLQHYESMGQTV